MGKVVVTGGFGYIGGRIVDHLQNQGYQVVVSSRRKQPPVWAEGIEVVDTEALVTDAGIDILSGCTAVVHLAGMNEVDCASQPAKALEVNGVYSVRLLEASIAMGIERFIYFSTAHVYRSPLIGSLDESSPTKPRHPYSISHRVVEDYVLMENESQRIQGMVVRLSNAVGTPMDGEVNRWMLVVNDLCMQAVQDGALKLKSSGIQERDFIPLVDVARAVQHLLQRRASPDLKLSPIFNLGSGISMSVYKLAELVRDRAERMLGKRLSIERPALKEVERREALHYSVERLIADGFKFSGSLVREIDMTLALCLQMEDES